MFSCLLHCCSLLTKSRGYLVLEGNSRTGNLLGSQCFPEIPEPSMLLVCWTLWAPTPVLADPLSSQGW